MEKNGLLWRPVSSDALQGRVLASVMAEQFGQDATVNLLTRNDAYGVGLNDVFKEAWTGAGGTIGEEVIFNPEGATLDTEAQQAVQGDPDAWLFITFCGDWAKLKGPLTRTGAWDPARTLESDTLQACTEVESTVEDMRGTIGNSSAGSSFAGYQELFESTAPEGVPFYGFTGQAFDSVFLAFLAALKAGSDDPMVFGPEIQASALPRRARSTPSSSCPTPSTPSSRARTSISRARAAPSTSMRMATSPPTCTTSGSPRPTAPTWSSRRSRSVLSPRPAPKRRGVGHRGLRPFACPGVHQATRAVR